MLSTTTPEIRYITSYEQPMKVAHYWVRLTRNGEGSSGYCDRRSVCRGCHRAGGISELSGWVLEGWTVGEPF